jgi:hypothetical protein
VQDFPTHAHVKGKTKNFFEIAMKIIASSLLGINIFFCLSVKAMEAKLGSVEPIKR